IMGLVILECEPEVLGNDRLANLPALFNERLHHSNSTVRHTAVKAYGEIMKKRRRNDSGLNSLLPIIIRICVEETN
ncbi:hypothetical protein PENTCL1PPCAC_2790, partial [Pristionchus entomophagus]